MKLSTPENPKSPESKAILLIGPPGGGKTILAMQFPEPEFMDCDGNLDGPDETLRKRIGLSTLSYGYTSTKKDDQGRILNIEERYDFLMTQLSAAKTTKSKTVIIDSLTLVNEFIVQKVLGTKPRTEVGIHEWMKIKSNFFDLLVARLRSIDKTTIVTVHEDDVVETDPKNIMNKMVVAYDPSIQGSTAKQLPGYFTDVWRCWSEPAPGDKQEFLIQTTATKKSRYLKNSFGLPSLIIIKQNELAWAKLEPFVKGKL